MGLEEHFGRASVDGYFGHFSFKGSELKLFSL